jgi:hypothetical protein
LRANFFRRPVFTMSMASIEMKQKASTRELNGPLFWYLFMLNVQGNLTLQISGSLLTTFLELIFSEEHFNYFYGLDAHETIRRVIQFHVALGTQQLLDGPNVFYLCWYISRLLSWFFFWKSSSTPLLPHHEK